MVDEIRLTQKNEKQTQPNLKENEISKSLQQLLNCNATQYVVKNYLTDVEIKQLQDEVRCIPCSSSSVECDFSMFKIYSSGRSSRLGPELCDGIMAVRQFKSNPALLEKEIISIMARDVKKT